jgi:hypothetical protein
LIIFLTFNAFRNDVPQTQALASALNKGDVQQINTWLDESVKLVMDGEKSRKDKKQAGDQLMSFFTQYPVQKFKMVHQADGKSATLIIGQLITKDRIFRTNVYCSIEKNNLKIQEIRFD